jgi:hypothetical protein
MDTYLAASLLVLGCVTLATEAGWLATLFSVACFGVAVGEFLAGRLKTRSPSPESNLISGLMLVPLLALWGWWLWRNGAPGILVIVIFGLGILQSVSGELQGYRLARQLYAEPPPAEELAWFDDLADEILTADPRNNDSIVDLPTRPHWKAKLLGALAIFVNVQHGVAMVLGRESFAIEPAPADTRTGAMRVVLQFRGMRESRKFAIDDASWANYLNWLPTNQVRSVGPRPETTGDPG